ncbi:Kelch-like protein 5, partial [Durusdinium trenchii]
MAKQEQKRQQRARRLSDLLALVLRRPQVACELGRFVGLWGAKCLAESSKHHGEHLRGAGLTRLREAALPEIYLCGGQSLRQTTPVLERYVHARREWEVLSPMPTARSFCCAAGLGGKIYVLGGEKDQRAAFAACECFDPQTGDWTRLPPMPTARAGAACAVADQKLVVCGGLVMAWQVLDVVEAFDPSVRKWRRLPAMPTPRCGCCACGVKGQILVMGGQLADGTVLDKVELLDLQRLVWDRLPAMPSPRSGGGCGLVGPERSGPGAVVYLLGGLGASGLTVPVVDRLDLEEKVWRTPFTTSLARAGCAVVTVGHEIHLLGGFDSNRQ